MGTPGCFVCGADNPFGLHISFTPENDRVVATFLCEARHSGWPGVLHGGITSALLDEASGYIPYNMGLVAMTAELNVSYLLPIRIGETVRIWAKPVRTSRRVIEVAAYIEDEDGVTRARSTAKMMVLTEHQQKSLEGIEDFSED